MSEKELHQGKRGISIKSEGEILQDTAALMCAHLTESGKNAAKVMVLSRTHGSGAHLEPKQSHGLGDRVKRGRAGRNATTVGFPGRCHSPKYSAL